MSPNLSSRDVREARSWLEPDTSGADGVTAFRGRSAMETSVFSGLCGNSEYIGPASGFVALDSMRQLQRHSSTCHQNRRHFLRPPSGSSPSAGFHHLFVIPGPREGWFSTESTDQRSTLPVGLRHGTYQPPNPKALNSLALKTIRSKSGGR